MKKNKPWGWRLFLWGTIVVTSVVSFAYGCATPEREMDEFCHTYSWHNHEVLVCE